MHLRDADGESNVSGTVLDGDMGPPETNDNESHDHTRMRRHHDHEKGHGHQDDKHQHNEDHRKHQHGRKRRDHDPKDPDIDHTGHNHRVKRSTDGEF